MKVFTHKYATEIYGTIVFSTGVSGMLTSVYIFVITYVFQVESNLAYLTVYMIGAGLNGLALFVSMFETSEPFVYPEKENYDALFVIYKIFIIYLILIYYLIVIIPRSFFSFFTCIIFIIT